LLCASNKYFTKQKQQAMCNQETNDMQSKDVQSENMQLSAYFYPLLIDYKGHKISHLPLKTCNIDTYEAHMKEAANFFKTVMPNVPVEINCHCYNSISDSNMLMASLYVAENKFVKH